MQQLSDALKPVDGRKTIFSFTGGLRCTLSSEPLCATSAPELTHYLCGVMDLMEQSRISMYRNLPQRRCGSMASAATDAKAQT